MSKNLKKIFLILTILLAATLRIGGVSPGYPPYHSDEGISYSAASSMIKNENLDPERYDYPSVVPLTNYLTFKYFFIPFSWTSYYLSNFAEIVDGYVNLLMDDKEYQKVFQLEILGERERNALFWGRYTTAALGVGVVFLIYVMGKELFSTNAGIIAAYLVAINFREVLNSHIGLPDVYNAFFLSLATVFAINYWKTKTKEAYVLAAITAGVAMSTKYQFFALIPVFLVHLYLSFEKDGLKEKIKYFFAPQALLAVFLVLFVFILLNPYALINFEETHEWLTFVSGKYRAGKNSLDFFPYSYLYHIGVGRITSVIAVFGIFVGLFKKTKATFVILSIVIPFFLLTTYFTGGGFYTRNFVTIIPFFLLFAGFFLAKMIEKRPKLLFLGIFMVLFSLASYENLSNSVVVAKEYEKPWNFSVVEEWIDENIPKDVVVAAHPSVPLTPGKYQKVDFELDDSFSVQEFKEDGASWAVMNLDWATLGFYGWMTQNTSKSLEYWEKPVESLEKTYAAMAIREFSDFAVYSVVNPWMAPESDFVVAKIPKYEYEQNNLLKEFEFVEPPKDNWKSEIIEIEDVSGLVINYELQVGSEGENARSGFLAIHFYKDEEDIGNINKRIAVRLSARARSEDGGLKELVVDVPEGANYAFIEFKNYNPARSTVFLEQLADYDADVERDFEGVEINPIELDNNIVFPNSHGNL